MSKISVKGGDMHPVYKFLTEKSKNGLEDSKVEWNFQKYLLDENGHLVRVVSPRVQPDDASIIEWIEKWFSVLFKTLKIVEILLIS